MGKKDDLLSALGEQMKESIGERSAVRREPPVKVKAEPNGRLLGRKRSRTTGELDLDRIVPDPWQPRKEFSQAGLHRMADNIKKFGVLQPIRVRWDDDRNKWVLISGERRYRAAKLAGLASIPCVFVENEIEESELRAQQLVENCQREDLKPVEQAKAFRSLIDATGWSTQRLATELNLSKATVVRSLALLKLPGDVQQKVDSGELASSTAYSLTRLRNVDDQRRGAEDVTRKGLTRIEAEQAVRKLQPDDQPKQKRPAVARFETRYATVIVEHHDPNATAADLQSALLAAVKQLGQRKRVVTSNNTGSG